MLRSYFGSGISFAIETGMVWKSHRKNPALFFVIVAVMVAIQACAPKQESEVGCNFVLNSIGQRVSWGAQTPVKLLVHESVPAQYNDALKSAAKTWNDLVGRQVIVIDQFGVSGLAEPSKDGLNVIHMMNDWDEDRYRTEQARTSIYWQGAQIVEADIRINDVGFDFSVSSPTPSGYVDFESLMVHEFGHVLGLAHAEIDGSVMAATLARGPSPEALRRNIDPSVDYSNSLACEY